MSVETLEKSSPEVKTENQTPKFDLSDDISAGQLLLEVDLKEKEKPKVEAEKPQAPTPEPTPKVDAKEQSAAKEPDWIPEKLKGKSKEEVIKIYLNAESAKTKAEQKLKEKEKEVKVEVKKPEEPKIDSDKFYQDLIDKPLEALAPIINAEVNKILDSGIVSRRVEEVIASKNEQMRKINAHIEELKGKYPDFEKLRSRTHEVMKELPEKLWEGDSGVDPMELAYKIARGETLEQASQAAEKVAQEEDANKTKVFAESPGASGSKISKPKASVDDDIKNSIINAGKGNSLIPD